MQDQPSMPTNINRSNPRSSTANSDQSQKIKSLHLPLRQQVNSLLTNPTTSLSDSQRANLQTLAQKPTFYWLTSDSQQGFDVLKRAVADAKETEYLSVVLYNIPHLGCNDQNGATSADAYLKWVDKIVAAIGNQPTIFVIEPDALPMQDCLNEEQRTQRSELISEAVKKINKIPSSRIFIDAGHSAWKPAQTMASYLRTAGVANADGFSLNVSNFQPNSDLETYGNEISRMLGGTQFIIDTSRNGTGAPANNDWCNPRGRGLGRSPQLFDQDTGLVGYMYIKVPGESDGNCNGGPNEGLFWVDYADELVRNAQKQ